MMYWHHLHSFPESGVSSIPMAQEAGCPVVLRMGDDCSEPTIFQLSAHLKPTPEWQNIQEIRGDPVATVRILRAM